MRKKYQFILRLEIEESDKKKKNKCVRPHKQACGEKQQQTKQNTIAISKQFWLQCGALKYRTTSRLCNNVA